MEDLSGLVVRGYELRERIGAGGFGAVYRAFQKSVDRDVAIKIILPEFACKPEFIQRFETEARMIARLEHLHIVPLFDYWSEPEGNAYIVMRWLRGGNLRTLLTNGPLSTDFILRMLRQIAEALETAHHAGVIHRDVKPDNILLDEQQNAYLSDFGIAKDTISSAHLTKSGTVGSPGYMAPEQFAGQAISQRADIYGLGMTLYECLCGTYPFPDSVLKHFVQSIPSVISCRPDLPRAVDAVLQRATAKNPSVRYETIAEFAHEFEDALLMSEKSTDLHALTELGEMVHGETLQIQTGEHEHETTMGQGAGDLTALLLEAEYDVPSRPRRLFGRETLIPDIQARLDAGERVLLQGVGGIGKTSLAAEVVAARLERGKGPILWIHAGNNNSSALMTALARALDPAVVLSSDAHPQAVRKLLNTHHVQLIVLDDVWNDKAMRYLLDALPARLSLLVTSRQRFPVGKIIDVGELELATSLELLGYHAGATCTIQDKAAVELCQQLGHHPFALELAGKTLQVDDLLPGELLRRIADAPHQIKAPPGSGETGRSSIRDLLDASVDALDDETRQAFFCFGSLAAPHATQDLIALLVNRDVENELATLVRRGLVKRAHHPGSEVVIFRLHDLAHSYARAKTLVERPHVIEACQTYTEKHMGDVDWLDAERSNILKAAQAAYDSGRSANLLAIIRMLTVDGPYLKARGHDALLLEQLDRAVDTARTLDEEQLLHYLLGKRADTYFERNQLAAALADYRELLALARKLNLADRIVILLCVASKTLQHQGDIETAETYLAEAERIAVGSADDLLISRVLENQGYYYAVTKADVATARPIFARQVQIAERLDNPGRLFFALVNLGVADTELGQYETAFGPLQRALQVALDVNNQPWQAHALFALATIHHKLTQRADAQRCLDNALALYRSSGNTAKVEELTAFLAENGYSSTGGK